VADIVLDLGRRVLVKFVGGLESGMEATHFGRFVLVGGRASIVEGSVAAMEAFLVGKDKVTRNDGGLLLRSQGRRRMWNAGWNGLSALLGDLNCRSVNDTRSVRRSNVERSVCERQNGILHRIERYVEIIRSAT
jgi:hypothetical protein